MGAGANMSQLANKVAEPGVDFDWICGSIAPPCHPTEFAQGAKHIWQK